MGGAYLHISTPDGGDNEAGFLWKTWIVESPFNSLGLRSPLDSEIILHCQCFPEEEAWAVILGSGFLWKPIACNSGGDVGDWIRL